MIGKLRGLVESVDADGLVIDVGGVGYVVSASARTLRALPAVGEGVSLLIETQVREDAIRLFGFLTVAERDWFRLLQNVQGVGAKVALGLLGALPGDSLATAIRNGDKTMISRAPGVGPKLAARLALELKDKVAALGSGDEPFASTQAALSGPAEDAVLALTGLGYARPQAAAAVGKALAASGSQAATAVLIRVALRELSQ